MSDPEQFAIVPVEGNSPPEAIVVGPMSEVTSYIGQSIARIEEEQRLAQAKEEAAAVSLQQDEIRAHAAQILTDGMARLSERLDAFVARRQERADQQKRDAEAAEIARIEAMLETLPDPDTPDAMRDSSHAPSGDLHSIAPVGREPLDHEGELPDPDDPENTRAEPVTGAMPPELDKGAPPEAGEYSATLPPPSKYRDPPSTGGA